VPDLVDHLPMALATLQPELLKSLIFTAELLGPQVVGNQFTSLSSAPLTHSARCFIRSGPQSHTITHNVSKTMEKLHCGSATASPQKAVTWLGTMTRSPRRRRMDRMAPDAGGVCRGPDPARGKARQPGPPWRQVPPASSALVLWAEGHLGHLALRLTPSQYFLHPARCNLFEK
jgi:hypothetical protein